MLETHDHEHNTFATLTYDDDHLPADGSLVPRDLRFLSSVGGSFTDPSDTTQ